MTEPRDLSPIEGDDALAAEYVLGVLPLDARLAAEARIRAEPDFAALVQRWENHFEALNDGYEAAPAPDLMPRIEAKIFGRQDAPKRNWWGFLVGAGAAAALALAVLVVIPSQTDGPVLTASLAADATELSFNVTYADGALTLARVAGNEAEAGRDYELWMIVGDAAPVSLGLITTAESTRALNALPEGAVLAVSLEPAGGSTTGAPTGPVLVTGVIVSS